jgi:hypothetical protein
MMRRPARILGYGLAGTLYEYREGDGIVVERDGIVVKSSGRSAIARLLMAASTR